MVDMGLLGEKGRAYLPTPFGSPSPAGQSFTFRVSALRSADLMAEMNAGPR
jgi:hypothetical protein